MIKLFHRTQAIEDNPITYPPAYYDDAYQALDIIDFYVKNNGGTCTRSEAEPVED